jgi:hypothetical protein
MNRYEVSIECKACHDGNHCDCSGGKKRQNNIVEIRCTCLFCRKRIAVKDSDDCTWEYNKDGQALESVGQSAANANMQPSS